MKCKWAVMSTITSTGEPSAWLLSSQIDELCLCHCALPTSRKGRPQPRLGAEVWGRGQGPGAGAEKGQIDAGLSVISSRAWATLAWTAPSWHSAAVSHPPPFLSSPCLLGGCSETQVCDACKPPPAKELGLNLYCVLHWKTGRWDSGRMGVSRD